MCIEYHWLLRHKTNSFPEIKQIASFGTAKQYNAIVNYIISWRFAVKRGFLTGFKKLVQYFSGLMWEIDWCYFKLKSKGMSFTEVVEKSFLGFDKLHSHGHAPNCLSSKPLALVVHNLYRYIDRQYMDSSLMKSFKDILFNVA